MPTTRRAITSLNAAINRTPGMFTSRRHPSCALARSGIGKAMSLRQARGRWVTKSVGVLFGAVSGLEELQ